MRFRFDAVDHAYYAVDTGEQLPHITGMLLQAGLVDDRWFTEEARDRGGLVHQLTADIDLGARRLEEIVSIHKGHVDAWLAACERLEVVEFLEVETAIVHPFYRFGGRPDRCAMAKGLLDRPVHTILELKTGAKHKAHGVQTALQAMLWAQRLGVPAPSLTRWCVYTQDDGRFKLEPHENLRDFDRALEVIKDTCQ